MDFEKTIRFITRAIMNMLELHRNNMGKFERGYKTPKDELTLDY